MNCSSVLKIIAFSFEPHWVILINRWFPQKIGKITTVTNTGTTASFYLISGLLPVWLSVHFHMKEAWWTVQIDLSSVFRLSFNVPHLQCTEQKIRFGIALWKYCCYYCYYHYSQTKSFITGCIILSVFYEGSVFYITVWKYIWMDYVISCLHLDCSFQLSGSDSHLVEYS